jgi:peptidase A4-like protein
MGTDVFDLPPKGFEPSNSTEEELRQYGLPFGRWRMRWGSDYQNIKPILEPSTRNRRHELRGMQLAVELAPVWSGVQVRAPSGARIDAVQAIWKVPNVLPPEGAPGIKYAASFWIGIDGQVPGSPDLLQAGVDCYFGLEDVDKPTVIAWVEWVPDNQVWITDLHVSPGDKIDCVIVVDPVTRKEATVHLHNLDRNAHRSVKVTAPTGMELKGNCAEWIVERIPYEAGGKRELANYDVVDFEDARAFTDKGLEVVWAPISYDMKVGGVVISKGESPGSALVRCTYQKVMRAAAGGGP